MPKRKKVLSVDERRGEEAFDRHQRIVDRISKIRKLTVDNIEDLDLFYNFEQYKVFLGDENATWSAYLSLPEVFLTRAEVHRMSQLKKRFVDEFGLKLEELLGLPSTKLHNIAHYADSKEQALDLIDKARTLTSRDWNEEMRKLAGKAVQGDGHEHAFQTVHICERCGAKERVG